MGTTYSPAPRDEQQWTALERDGYRDPRGLQLNLPFYLLRRFFKPANPIALFEHDEVNVIMQLYNFLIALPRAEAYLHWPIAGLVRFRRARNRLDKVVQRMISHHRAVEWTGATCFPCCWLRAMRNPTTPV